MILKKMVGNHLSGQKHFLTVALGKQGKERPLVIDLNAALAAALQASDKSHASLFSLSPDAAQPRMLPQDHYRALIPLFNGRENNIVNQTVQFMGEQALRLYKITFLQRIHWVEIYSNRNLTNSPEERTVASTTSLTLTTGQEANTEFGLSASFRGLGLSFGTGQRTFRAVETTESRTETHTYIIPPGESLYVYQRHYEFVDMFRWTFEASGTVFNVVESLLIPQMPVHSTTNVTISADEFMSRLEPPIESTLTVDIQRATEIQFGHLPGRTLGNISASAQRSINNFRAQLFVSISQISYPISC